MRSEQTWSSVLRVGNGEVRGCARTLDLGNGRSFQIGQSSRRAIGSIGSINHRTMKNSPPSDNAYGAECPLAVRNGSPIPRHVLASTTPFVFEADPRNRQHANRFKHELVEKVEIFESRPLSARPWHFIVWSETDSQTTVFFEWLTLKKYRPSHIVRPVFDSSSTCTNLAELE